MVAARLAESKDWNKTPWKLGEPSADTLFNRYKRWRGRKGVETLFKDALPTAEWNSSRYLDRFPAVVVPPHLRNRFELPVRGKPTLHK